MRALAGRLALVIGSALLLSCGGSQPPAPAELVVRSEETIRERFGRDVQRLLLARQYDSLETLARALRTDKVRWPHGGWKLRSFYTYGFNGLPEGSTETEWATALERLGEWMKLQPRSVTARVASAEMLVAYAWVARGNGTASEVTDSGGDLMLQRLAAATAILAEAQRIGEPCPGWWDAAMSVALLTVSDRSAYERLFQDAIAHEPTYEAFYIAHAVYLLPRWHGRPGEWEAWLDQALPADAGGDELYARTVWGIRRQLDDDFWVEAAPSWERTRRGYASLVKAHPQSLELRSAFAYLAWKVEDRETARQLFEELGPSVDPEVWSGREEFMEARRWARGNG
jgi:hypothetical protein